MSELETRCSRNAMNGFAILANGSVLFSESRDSTATLETEIAQ